MPNGVALNLKIKLHIGIFIWEECFRFMVQRLFFVYSCGEVLKRQEDEAAQQRKNKKAVNRLYSQSRYNRNRRVKQESRQSREI